VRQVDVAIAGGGLVGLALALAVKRSSAGALSVAVIDPAGGAAAADGRASAIAAGARRMLETLGGWPTDPRDAQPILDMIVTDGRVEDGVRPAILTFGGEAEPGEPFAHMVENATLIATLASAAMGSGVDILRTRVTAYRADGARAVAHLADGTDVAASLLAACDGARSALREAAGIRMVGWDYGQSGIVTTIVHERPHHGRAEEHFLPAGPFAVLPLTDDAEGRHRSSLVWTERTADAERYVTSPDAAFLASLVERLGHHLGEVALAGPRRALPLGLKVARSFVADRLALVGDAAHVIHPIAGQGLNMGFRDVAALAEVVVDAARLGQDIGQADVLERYQRWRRFDTTVMGATTDALNRLFSNDNGLLRGVRDLGLGMVDRMPFMKRFFIQSAAGLAGELPKLLQGRMV
jgi:2-octaprenyl-6-methoxyphenol hydroxylase